MRVLITSLPATGSLHPLRPVAAALADAGHDIAFCSAPRFRPAVEASGFAFLGAGLDYAFSEPGYLETLAAAAGGVELPPPPGVDRLAWVTDRLFIRGAARQMLPDVLDAAENWGADLVLRDSLEFAGCVAAEALGLPHASVAAPSNGALDQRNALAAPLSVLRGDAGLPPDPETVMPYRYLHLCSTPPSFDGPTARFPATTRLFRHVDGGDTRPLPGWATAPDRPAVLVSLGTVFHRTPGVYEAAVAGLANEPLHVGVALGPERDPATLGPVPPNVHLESFLPMRALLDRAALLITHGGFSSVKEAMSRGVPMVVVPIASDQHYSAARLADLGLTEVVEPNERTEDRIRTAARTVLGDPGYRRRAHRMAADMAALPPVTETVDWLEALTSRTTSAAAQA